MLLTDARYEAPTAETPYVAQMLMEERLLKERLEARGFRGVRVAWSNPDFDWSTARAAVFRSTWDYHQRFGEFVSWLKRVEGRIRLINPPGLVRWNLDKRYLLELRQAGVGIPPTRYLEAGKPVDLRMVIAETGWPEVILKPAVSAAARHTYRLKLETLSSREAVIQERLREEGFLMQPFLSGILSVGEISLVMIGGRCTHAVRKMAKPGDFRVQDDHGGTAHAYEPAADEVAFAERAVAACPERPVYARVDVVRGDDGALLLMELELVEPELFFRLHPPAAERMAERIVEAVGG